MPDATLDRLIRPTGAPYPANHTHINNEITLRSPLTRADTGKSGVRIWRLIPFFLFLRVTDQSTQLLRSASGHRFNTSAMASSPWSIDDRAGFPVYGTAPPAGCDGFQLIQRLTDRFNIALAQHLTMSCNWRRRPSILIRWASSIARADPHLTGSYPARFSPDQQFRAKAF